MISLMVALVVVKPFAQTRRPQHVFLKFLVRVDYLVLGRRGCRVPGFGRSGRAVLTHLGRVRTGAAAVPRVVHLRLTSEIGTFQRSTVFLGA